MNIVYVHAHDLGRYCEPMGYAIPAPHLKKLAREGTLFRNCYASAPSCAPSRAALVTGRHPHSCGMLGLPNAHLGYRLNDYSQHLGRFLQQHGYETALSGVQHVARMPMVNPLEVLGYDRFLNADDDKIGNGHDRATTLSAAIKYLNEDHDKPFFLSVGFCDPHRNNGGDKRTFVETYSITQPADIDDDARYCLPMPHLPDVPELRREMANFKMGVEVLDNQIGALMAVVNQPRLRDNTLVIFTTDHGPGVSEMKCTLSDRGTGVTTIIRGPKDGAVAVFNGGKIVDELCQHMDFYPTICELIGAEKPDYLQGESLMPLLTGEKESIHDAIYTEQTYHYGSAARPFRAVRTKRYKYIRCYDVNAPWDVDHGPCGEFLEQYGYGKQPHPNEELYDLIFDPHEANNLADRPGHEQLLDEMRAMLREWQEKTDDPVRDGVVPAPPGAANHQ